MILLVRDLFLNFHTNLVLVLGHKADFWLACGTCRYLYRHLILGATLDEGPKSRDQWIQAILLVESFKLVPRPLDEGSRPKKMANQG
jgi:hypothetical protein